MTCGRFAWVGAWTLLPASVISGPAHAAIDQAQTPVDPAAKDPGQATAKPDSGPGPGKEIVVVGKRSSTEDSVDRITYSFDGDPDAKTGMAIDLLRKVPSVQTTPAGGVALRGDSRVNVLIDGKRPSNGNQGLQSLSGAEVDRIEVMTNPSTAFAPDGAAGVINIITKRRTPIGLSGSANARVTSRNRQLASALANLSNGQYSAKGAFNAQHTALPSDTVTIYNQPSRALQSNRVRGDNKNARLDLTLKSRIGEEGALSIMLLAFEGKRKSNDATVYNGDILSYSGNTASTNRFSNRVIEGLYESKSTAGDINFSIDARHETKRSPYRSDTILDLESGGRTLYGQNLDADGSADNLKFDWVWSGQSERELKLGWEIDDVGTRTDNQFYSSGLADGPIETNGAFRFRGRQTLFSGYVTWQQSIFGWTALAGLRGEQQALNLRSDDIAVRRDNPAAYPSLHLSHDIGKDQKFKLSYSRRVSRPTIEDYNPGVRTQTTNVTEIGNPNLISSKTDSFEAQYVFNRKSIYYSASLFYKYTGDLQGDFSTISPTGQITIMPINQGHSSSTGISATVRIPIAKNLKSSFDANIAQVSQPSISGEQRNYIRSNASYTLEFKPSSKNPDGGDTYQFQAIYTGRTLNLQGYTAATYRLDATWLHPINKGLSLTLSATDITNGQRSRIVVDSPGVFYSIRSRPYTRSLQLGIAYTFK